MSLPDPRARSRFDPEEQPPSLSDLRQQPYRIHTDLSMVAPVEADSLGSVLRNVRRSWWIILICAAAAGGAGIAIARTKSQQYQASTYLLINGSTYQSVIAGGYNPSDLQTQQATIAGLLTPKLIASAAKQAGLPANAAYSVAPAAASNSSVMRIVASAGRQQYAAALSTAVSQGLVSFLQRSNASQLLDAKRVIRSQVAHARSSNDRHTLTGELNNLDDLKALVNNQVQIIETPQFGIPIPLKTARTGAIGLVIGVLFGLAVSLLRRRELPAVA